ncbi:hypothetical protein C1170_00495 [Stutzerimonas frequens]|nr:hypothetical protein C1170_00495 [Stutzerimonas frequens]
MSRKSGNSGAFVWKVALAMLAIGVLAKAVQLLIIAGILFLLYCLVRAPGPTLGFLVLGLIGAILKRVPDPYIMMGFGAVLLAWVISILRKREPAPMAESGNQPLISDTGARKDISQD